MQKALSERIFAFSYNGKRFSRICLDKYFYLFLFLSASLITIFDKEVLGAVLFVALISVLLVLCDDIVAVGLPFLLLCVFVTKCYDSASTFIKFWWMAIPVAFALIFHFVVYRKNIRIGRSIWGLIAVSLAVTFAGVSFASRSEYFNATTLYYTFFLGIGMVGLYLLLKSQLCAKRDYDVREKAISILYIMGMFACLMVAVHTIKSLPDFGAKFQPSNNISTFLMIALPCPFFFVPKNRWHILSSVIMLTCMIFSHSRAGLLLGTVEFFICLAVSAIWDKKRRFLYICAILVSVGAVIVCKDYLILLAQKLNAYPLINENEPRVKLIKKAYEFFWQNPVFGHGLGFRGNYKIYNPKGGAMGWYHMMIPQIVGSMGLLGIAAYSTQAVVQIRTAVFALRRRAEKNKSAVITLLLSYLGLLMMSQLNPGLFCPLPYGLIGMLVFALIDGDDGMSGVFDLVNKIKERKERRAEPESVTLDSDESERNINAEESVTADEMPEDIPTEKTRRVAVAVRHKRVKKKITAEKKEEPKPTVLKRKERINRTKRRKYKNYSNEKIYSQEEYR